MAKGAYECDNCEEVYPKLRGGNGSLDALIVAKL